ncbi:MAG: 4-hydroxy-tetrahydrodipicolinate reductase [Flavobacteriales bacterium CG_4_10_14_0_2_um_filter_32_8]|nr:MAG: 4-hydroxy-tetrahydrodipicolinate reductase [Flavobacteriales bacterium CG_4_10_14_0_2_um_filter_32_8]PJB15832.1 MAG: 4-hydroxy-tetrahydrodipicolinate reductase [Flavobacteriales bacterium CG_4_9_14_3_um_filter_32_8]
MKIGIIGYGKMGKELEKVAIERGHEVTLKISSQNTHEFNFDNLKKVDVAIEFTNPELAVNNINVCLASNTPIVVGTTGWYANFDEIKKSIIQNDGTLLYATNCSIGVNLFFKLNNYLAKMMNKYPEYDVRIEETHHTQKIDAPSGTAITLAEDIVGNLDEKESWVNGESIHKNQLTVLSHRIENVPGTHEIKYTSAIDNIEIKHTAHNRKGFAMGAIIAAEYIKDKKGIFTMEDVLFN